MPRSDLPFGSEFSPAQIDLPVLLELASEHQDDWHAFEAPVILSSEQHAYLKALVNVANVDSSTAYLSSDIETLAAATYRTAFDKRNLPTQVLYPLQDTGYIDFYRGVSKGNYAAESFLVTATEKLTNEIITPRIEQLERQTHADLWPLLRKPLKNVREEIENGHHQIRGLALEVLVFKLMRLIDLPYVASRPRGTTTRGTSVSLIFESDRLVFPRWQIRCKDAAGVSIDDAAIEMGLTHILKSDVIVIASTGWIDDSARRYADKIMVDSNLFIVMADGSDLSRITARPALIVELLNRETRHALRLKKLSRQCLNGVQGSRTYRESDTR